MNVLLNNVPVTFQKADNLFGTPAWSAAVTIAGNHRDIEFAEAIFRQTNDNLNEVDWKLIEAFLQHIHNNIHTIQKKGSAVLNELHKQVFGEEEHARLNNQLQAAIFTLTSFTQDLPGKYQYEYEVVFCFDDDLYDPNYSYYARFSNFNGLSIIGASRE